MENKFFHLALKRAAKLTTKHSGLLLLLVQLTRKVATINWKYDTIVMAKEKLFTFGRLIKAYAAGHYRDIPLKRMSAIIAAVLYFVSPIDLIPDFIPVTGLTDDFGILLAVFNTVSKEIDNFLIWEKTTAALS